MIIGKTEILEGQNELVKIPVGRLPSGTRINITAHVFRSKNPGPTGLVLAGVHGDEINGIEIVRKTLNSGIGAQLKKGSLIIIPLLNVYGFINFSRDVPDGKDVNRNFPGSFSGSLASRVARTLTKKILPFVDFGIDLHTGGASRYNYPQTRFYKDDPIARELAIAFGAPLAIEKPLIARSLRKAAKDMDIPVVVFEGGESVRLDGFSIQKGIEGVRKVLKYKGMIDANLNNADKIRVFKKTKWIRSPQSGIFIWSQNSGTTITKGEPLGVINDPHGTKSVSVISPTSGVIIGHNNASVVNQGDALFNVGYDYSYV